MKPGEVEKRFMRNLAALKERFEKYVVKLESGCHEWNGPKTKDGYGRISIKSTNGYAHRISYLLYKGETGRLCVCHTCDNPSCVNPDHLFLGTQKDNAYDMLKKNRCNSTKITEKDVRFIRDSPLTVTELCKIYNMSYSAIFNVKNRKTWLHII